MWATSQDNYLTTSTYRGMSVFGMQTTQPNLSVGGSFLMGKQQRSASPLYVPNHAGDFLENNFISSYQQQYQQYHQFQKLHQQYLQYQQQYGKQQAHMSQNLDYQRRLDFQKQLEYQQQQYQKFQQEYHSQQSFSKFEDISSSKEELSESPVFSEEHFPSLGEKKKKSSPKKSSPPTRKSPAIDLEIFLPYQTDPHVQQVWAYNLEEELGKISTMAKKFPYIAMDTEFPGIVYQPEGYNYKDKTHAYSYLKANVDNLELIQIGLTLSNEKGELPSGVSTWQFNFKFDPTRQAHNRNSINMLKSAGIDFPFFSQHGIDQRVFGTSLIQSGLVLNDKIKWIAFHSMFDFGYLVKLLIATNLPTTESQFFSLLHTFFRCVYDLKHFLSNYTTLENKEGSLDTIARSFNLTRVGTAHQAGSDSLLTCNLFFSLTQAFRDLWKEDKLYKGVVYGLNYLPVGGKASANSTVVSY